MIFSSKSNKSRTEANINLNAGDALRESIINTPSLHLNNSAQRKHIYEHSLASYQWVGGSRSKERDQKSELGLRSTFLNGIETTRSEIFIM